MKNAKELLESLNGMKVFTTTRGTIGDASGMLQVNEAVIEEYEYADVCTLPELKEINEDAYSDCVDYIENDAELRKWEHSLFYVIYQDCDYLLVWEQE